MGLRRSGARSQRRRKGRGRRRVTKRRYLRRLGTVIVFGILSVVVASMLAVVPLRWVDPPTTAFMLADPRETENLRYTWTPWSSLGEPLPLAVVAAEDQKFLEHFGFDVTSIRESVVDYRNGDSLRGASTITQQVAKNLYLWRNRSFLRKGIEAWLALLLEAALQKRRILEIYLNIAEFGPGIYGAGAASHAFFGRPPGELRDSEAALLAAVLPNPNRLHVVRPSDYVRERQRWISEQMVRLRREQWLLSLDSGS